MKVPLYIGRPTGFAVGVMVLLPMTISGTRYWDLVSPCKTGARVLEDDLRHGDGYRRGRLTVKRLLTTNGGEDRGRQGSGSGSRRCSGNGLLERQRSALMDSTQALERIHKRIDEFGASPPDSRAHPSLISDCVYLKTYRSYSQTGNHSG